MKSICLGFLFFSSSFFQYKFIYFNWRLITLQYCISFAIHQHESTMGAHPEHPSHFPPHTIPLGHPSALAPSIEYRASNLDWQLIFIHDIIHVSMPFSQIFLTDSFLDGYLGCLHVLATVNSGAVNTGVHVSF